MAEGSQSDVNILDHRTLHRSYAISCPPALEPGVRLKTMDSLRGLAAMVVVWHHFVVLFPASFALLRDRSPVLYSLALWVSDQNLNAVLVFFVLSGISIRIALSNEAFSLPGSIAHYARRRAARILPLYWLALGWTTVFGLFYGLNDPSFRLWNLVGNLVFFQTSSSARGVWFVPFGRNGPLWSLSYEVFFYTLLPVVLSILGLRKGLRNSALNFLLFGTLAISIVAIALGRNFANPFIAFLSYWAIWMYGFVLGDLLLRPRVAYVLGLPAPISLLVLHLVRASGLQSATLGVLVMGLCIGSLFAGVYFTWMVLPQFIRHDCKEAFNTAFLPVGRGSYALYLLHYPLLLAVAEASHKYDARVALTTTWAIAVISVLALLWCPWLESVLRKPSRRLFG